ncbi:hypothetical protein A2U01_0097986 [Trifolium medium]|nr:hypothetical protein [Trifolium medium]
MRVAQSPEPLQLPEALPARRANIPARRARDRSNFENLFQVFKATAQQISTLPLKRL